MTTKEQLDYLQEKLSDKSLSLGCMVYIGRWDWGLGDSKYKDTICKISKNSSGSNIYLCGKSDSRHFNFSESEGRKNSGIIEIIGHPVMSDHILLWMKNNKKGGYLSGEGYFVIYQHKEDSIPWQLGKDLTQQSKDTINELYLFVKQVEEGNYIK